MMADGTDHAFRENRPARQKSFHACEHQARDVYVIDLE
jgi:hypothetical protein